MAEDSKFDMAMLFTLKDGGTVWAESTMFVDPTDLLMKEFKPITSYDDYSNFFEITTFSMHMELKPDESGVASINKAGAAAPKGQAAPKKDDADSANSAFDRWRSATKAEAEKMKFPLEFQAFSFTRVIDGASPLFFQSCATQTSFKRAILVKRVSTGERVGLERTSLAFMRMEFENVMLKSVNWQDGDLVTETCTFICTSMKMKYRQQVASGDLNAATEASWDREKDAVARKVTL